MGVIKIEGKSVTLDDAIIDAGIPAIKAALSVDFPDVENADIEIIGSRAPGVVRSATVVKRGTGKGNDEGGRMKDEFNPPPTIFEPDFNDRERLRMSGQLRELAKQASAAADALELRHDSEFVTQFLMFTLAGGSKTQEIMEQVSGAVKKKDEEFPSIIGG